MKKVILIICLLFIVGCEKEKEAIVGDVRFHNGQIQVFRIQLWAENGAWRCFDSYFTDLNKAEYIWLRRKVTDLEGRIMCLESGGHKPVFKSVEDSMVSGKYSKTFIFRCQCGTSFFKYINTLDDKETKALKSLGVLK